jgi:lipopolysaccharide/colanic/teichoic acid biosynthesis glycosyltransferase
MSQSLRHENRNWVALLDLFACLAGFGLAALCERLWFGPVAWHRPRSWVLAWILSAAIGWLAMVFPEGQWHEGVRLWVDGFLAIMGTNLLVQCGLTYLLGLPPASWLVIILGSAFSIGTAVLLRIWNPAGAIDDRKGILFVGFDNVTTSLADTLREKIVGGLGSLTEDIPPRLQVLGPTEQLNKVCETKGPDSIILSGKPAGVSFRQLLQLHYSGIDVEGAPYLYERISQRIAWQYLQPSDLLFFLNPNSSPAMVAFQAVYKNLLGLTLRIIFAPLLILASLLIVIFTGGPALERIECLGFRRIPFQMLRFRIYRSDGNPSWIGNLIVRLRLTNLPQLMNVVRGEMTLFGPAPVRTAFAHRMNELLPAYAYRFTVKPGILGWADASLEEPGGLQDEALLLELDLYYVKQESPSLDLDILLRTFFRRSPAKRPAAAAVAE